MKNRIYSLALIYPLVLSLSALLLASTADIACANDILAKTYDIKDVSALEVQQGGQIFIAQGDTEILKIEASAEVLTRINVDLTQDKLTLKINNPKGFFRRFHNLDFKPEMATYHLQVKDLRTLGLSGAVQANLGDWHTKSLRISASGASELTVKKLNADALVIDLSGASQAHLQQLMANHANFTLSGASQLEVSSASKTSQLQLNASGASNFHTKKLEASSAEIELSGASSCEVFATSSLIAEASGVSHIHYLGNPKTTFRSSGASNITSIQ
jgi:hypothetical protein